MPSVRGSKCSLLVEISDDEGGIIVKRLARAETIGSIPNPEPTSGDTHVRDSEATANVFVLVFVPPRVPVLEIPDSQDEGDDDSEDEQMPLRQHMNELRDLDDDWDKNFEKAEMSKEDKSVYNLEGCSDTKDKSLSMENVPKELNVTDMDEVIVTEEVKITDLLADMSNLILLSVDQS